TCQTRDWGRERMDKPHPLINHTPYPLDS
uniref:Uncharacterized protein n=1 Tax=Amphimedon queenslandica TaxID=400682 RepID=A0A1X7SI61_AMPQE